MLTTKKFIFIYFSFPLISFKKYMSLLFVSINTNNKVYFNLYLKIIGNIFVKYISFRNEIFWINYFKSGLNIISVLFLYIY